MTRVARPLPTDPGDPRFDRARPVHMALAPFRAHEATVPGLTVRALHDGQPAGAGRSAHLFCLGSAGG